MHRILHLILALIALGLVLAYIMSPIAAVTSPDGPARPIYGLDYTVAWAVFGLAILGFLRGLLGVQSGGDSHLTHFTCSLLGLFGSLAVAFQLVQIRRDVLGEAALAVGEAAKHVTTFEFCPGFTALMGLQAAWLVVSLFALTMRDQKPFHEMKEVKAKIEQKPA